MTDPDAETIRVAAELIEGEARVLRECHVRMGATDWPAAGSEAKEQHDLLVSIVADLRAILVGRRARTDALKRRLAIIVVALGMVVFWTWVVAGAFA